MKRSTFLETWERLRDVNTAVLGWPDLTLGELRIVTVLITHMALYCRTSDHFTHRRLAELAHVHRNTVPRVLKKLDERDVIDYEPGKYRGAASRITLLKDHSLDGGLWWEESPQPERESPQPEALKPTTRTPKAHHLDCAIPSSSEFFRVTPEPARCADNCDGIWHELEGGYARCPQTDPLTAWSRR